VRLARAVLQLSNHNGFTMENNIFYRSSFCRWKRAASRSGRLIIGVKIQGMHSTGGWTNLGASLDDVKKKKGFHCCRASSPLLYRLSCPLFLNNKMHANIIVRIATASSSERVRCFERIYRLYVQDRKVRQSRDQSTQGEASKTHSPGS
jgi:hypothetical protein